MDSGVFSTETEAYLEKVPETTSEKIGHFLHSSTCHLIVIVLVLVDCAFVLTELIFDGKLDTYDEYCNPTPSCSEQSHKLHHWEHVTHAIHICSILVLSIFMAEVVLKIVFTRAHFFSHKIEMIDGVVVLLSWILDLIMLNPNLVGKWAEFIIVFRFIRLINGMILSAKQATDKRVHEQKRKVQQLEKEVEDLKKQLKTIEQ
ncbi:Oidioi.mRNA.OKI2018_I69.chr2.g5698.t1.cds [Oikopleura dioica]|uniref:Voltage-gated hydrogen channel 1 n=1 Tax=Oikopleura dioica TaxID=34765 RepID=A0ABN7T5E4_OIKDI|nr:Oidioi.mRNA.OKI2018_I69.chr2.g5698.t1.cds [Oikopleura dioica]